MAQRVKELESTIRGGGAGTGGDNEGAMEELSRLLEKEREKSKMLINDAKVGQNAYATLVCQPFPLFQFLERY